LFKEATIDTETMLSEHHVEDSFFPNKVKLYPQIYKDLFYFENAKSGSENITLITLTRTI
jgi:hypothetical protein